MYNINFNEQFCIKIGDSCQVFPPTPTQLSYFLQMVSEEHGYELWISDGIQANISLFADLHPGPESSYPDLLTPLPNGRIVFLADDGLHGLELWTTDCNSPPELIHDILPGNTSSYDGFPVMIVLHNHLFFQPMLDFNLVIYDNLWYTDGTPGNAGTPLSK